MRIRQLVSIALVLAAAGALVLAADPSQILTTTELKQLVDSGQYRDALKAMIRILDLKGAAAAPYDRNEILLLRAECQLQLKLAQPAMDTLDTVRKEAVEANNDDHIAQAVALKMLIQKSPGQNYTPRTGATRKPIPILDRTLRKAAYDALLADEMIPLDAKVKLAAKATTLQPIVDAAKSVGEVRAVEHVSTGNNTQTEKITKDLTAQSLKLFGTALDDMTANTQRISDSANRIITENVTMTDAQGHQYIQQQTHRKGLTPQDIQTLKGVKSECEKIPQGAIEMAQGLGADAAPFKAIGTKAETLKDKAAAVLTDDYTNAFHSN